MLLSDYLSPSLEAIRHQSGMLHKELTLAVKKVREADPKLFDKALKDAKIPELIARHTGLSVVLECADTSLINAWVRPPLLDKNHVLLNDFRHDDVFSLEGLAAVRGGKGIIKGEVNLASSTVSGVFSDLVTTVSLTKGLLKSPKFTEAEVSAIVLHELGHLFTMFEHMGRTLTTNFVLQSVTHELFEQPDIKRKYQVIEEASNVLGIDIDDPEALVSAKNKEVVQVVVLREQLLKKESELGSRTQDATSWEMMADQFANRHGAGRDLVTGLGKMVRGLLVAESLSLPTYLLMEAIKFTLIIGGLMSLQVPVFFIAALQAVVIDSNYSDYDRITARLERIKRDLVAKLKERDLPKTERERIQADLDAMDAVLKGYTSRRTLLQLFHSSLIPGRRKQYQQVVFQQELEKLAINDLFVQANKFNLLVS